MCIKVDSVFSDIFKSISMIPKRLDTNYPYLGVSKKPSPFFDVRWDPIFVIFNNFFEAMAFPVLISNSPIK